MASDSHDEIKRFLSQAAASGNMPSGKRMIFNRVTGKFEVVSGQERPGDTVPQMTPQDMRAFGHG